MNIEPAAAAVGQVARRIGAATDDARATVDDLRSATDDLFADPPWGNSMPWWKSPLDVQDAPRPRDIHVNWTDPAGKRGPRYVSANRSYSMHFDLRVKGGQGEERISLQKTYGPSKMINENSEYASHHFVHSQQFDGDLAQPEVRQAMEDLQDVVVRSGLQEASQVSALSTTGPFLSAGDGAASLLYGAGAGPHAPQFFHLRKMQDKQPLVDVIESARRLWRTVDESPLHPPPPLG